MYALLRVLWDDTIIPSATLTAGGLASASIPRLLFLYEASETPTDWDKIMTKTEWNDDISLLSHL